MTEVRLPRPWWLSLARWFDAHAGAGAVETARQGVDWLRMTPFLAMHLACFAVLWVGWSWTAVLIAAALYALRMVAITGFYHRYFAHRSFKTSRGMQLLFAVLGASAAQRGPLWWASHHRQHHARADQPDDPHSPRHHGFLWSHMGWFGAPDHFPTRFDRVKDLAQYPELRFLDRFDVLVPVALMALLFGLGAVLERFAPALGTDGPQLLVWGFFVSTVALYHATYTINSLAHRIGRQRYATRDDSRNSLFLALLTFGEGWHNNHHHYPASARQGFYWWEVDLTYYCLWLLARLGLIWDLKPVPHRIRDSRRLGA